MVTVTGGADIGVALLRLTVPASAPYAGPSAAGPLHLAVPPGTAPGT